MRRTLWIGLLIVLSVVPAYPQNRDILQLQKDMIEVQTRVRQLQTTVDQDDAVLKGLMEKMTDQVNTLAGSLQKINQSIDSLNTKGDAATRDLRVGIGTLNATVKEMEEGLSSARAQINAISREIASLKTTSTPLESADELWRSANVDYTVGNYDLAISGFQEFLSKYPTDPRGADAQLRIGDAQFAEKKYDLALTQYDIVLQKYPDSDKTKTALLKKGLAQAETNQPQASTTLNEVVKKFPGTSEASTASAKLREMQGAGQRRTTPGR